MTPGITSLYTYTEQILCWSDIYVAFPQKRHTYIPKWFYIYTHTLNPYVIKKIKHSILFQQITIINKHTKSN